MTTLNVNTIKPAGDTLNLGESGDSVVFADDVKVNTVKDGGDGYKYASFTSTGAGTWTCPAGVTEAEILIVAGGGGGAGSNAGGETGGGAGAGGVVHHSSYTVVPAVVYDITVGAGGAGGTNEADGSAGSDSVFNVNAEGSGSTMTAVGGAGGDDNGAGLNGGSGGGSGQGTAGGGTATQGDSGGGTGYGNDGGGGGNAGNSASGGGAGGVGVTGDTTNDSGGIGGDGRLFSNFTSYGTSGYFAGGGTGGSISNAAPGSSTGGGGAGGMDSNGGDGTANTGGGGGGAGGSTANGGTGGSGIIIIRYQDGTPNTLWVSDGSGNLSSVNPYLGGAMKLISSTTVSSQASLSITSGFSSTYSQYIFTFINIFPQNNDTQLTFQCSIDGGSNYNVTLTSTVFNAEHNEADTVAALTNHSGSYGQGNGTNYQLLAEGVGSDADESSSGELHLFNPSSTVYVKNYWSRINTYRHSPGTRETFTAGFFNTTSAINAISFKMVAGNITGIFKMYGVA